MGSVLVIIFEMKICSLVNLSRLQQMKCKHFFVFTVPKIYPSVNYITTQQRKCKHFFVFAAQKFGGLRKSAYFCPRHKGKLKNDHRARICPV